MKIKMLCMLLVTLCLSVFASSGEYYNRPMKNISCNKPQDQHVTGSDKPVAADNDEFEFSPVHLLLFEI